MWSDHRGYWIRVFCHDKSSYIHQFETRISQTFYPANSLEYKLREILCFVDVLFPRMLRTDRISRTYSGRLSFKHLTDEDEKGPPGDGLCHSMMTYGLKLLLHPHRVGLWVSLSKNCQYFHMYLWSRLQEVHCYLSWERHAFVLPELSQWYWATCW